MTSFADDAEFKFFHNLLKALVTFSTVDSIPSYDHVLHLFKHFSYSPSQQLKWCFPYETVWDSSLFLGRSSQYYLWLICETNVIIYYIMFNISLQGFLYIVFFF